MAIKVVVNYPKTEEGLRLFEESQAVAALKILRKILSRDELDQVMERLAEQINSK